MPVKTIRCPLPSHEDRTPSCAHYDAGTPKEHWHCFGCGWHGDRVRYEVDVNGLTMPEALKLHGKGQRPPKAAPKPPPKKTAEDERKVAAAARIWSECKPLRGTPGADYIRSRGVTITHRNLAYHDAYPFKGGDKPAVVARLVDKDHKFTGVQGIAADGSRKQSRGVVSGSGCYLGYELWPVLLVAEGVITALSAWESIRVHRRTDPDDAPPTLMLKCCPVACMGSSLRTFAPPPSTVRIYIAADNDRPGRDAAIALKRKLQERCPVTIFRPEQEGWDYNDVLKRGR